MMASRNLPEGRKASRRARGPQVTKRDIDMLRWATRHGTVTPDLIGVRFFWRPDRGRYGSRAMYQRLRNLESLGLIVIDKPFAHRPAAVRVTEGGARLADVGLRPANLVLHDLEHTIELVWLTEGLLAHNPGAQLQTERELRAQRYRADRETDWHHTHRGRCPDALLLLPGKGAYDESVRRIAIEVDLSRKERRTLQSIINDYDHERVDEVWWYAAPELVPRITRIFTGIHAGRRYTVRDLPPRPQFTNGVLATAAAAPTPRRKRGPRLVSRRVSVAVRVTANRASLTPMSVARPGTIQL